MTTGIRSDFVADRQLMKKASLAAAFAASLCLSPISLCLAAEGAPVDEARVAEEQLLGTADEEARFLSLQPFTREIAASVVIKASLDQALDDLGVPAATMLEGLRAFTAR